jgi:hypothetical protein
MKFNRLLIAFVLGLSFFATSSVYASDNGGGGQQSHSTMLGWLYNLITGQGGYGDDNQGKECDHGHGNDSSGCPASSGGSTGGGGGSTSGGGTGGPKG